MDLWLIGLIVAAGVVVLYLVLLAVGVMLGIGGVLMQVHRGRADADEPTPEMSPTPVPNREIRRRLRADRYL